MSPFELSDRKKKYQLVHGDSLELIKTIPDSSLALTVTSPPYCMGKEYDNADDLESFSSIHKTLLPELVRATKDGGSICWQIGYFVRSGQVFPLDYFVYEIARTIPELQLRNRIVWTFGHGIHCQRRLSGRHEVILWFSKGDQYKFNLDAVRIPQKYPGKTHYRGKRRGEISGNPMGKNPSDVWEIPNVKANHVEKTQHPCQFPVALVRRLVRALTKPGDLVCDPFMGSGTTGTAALIEKRRFWGCDSSKKYFRIATKRIEDATKGNAVVRPDVPVWQPTGDEKVARKPANFVFRSETSA